MNDTGVIQSHALTSGSDHQSQFCFTQRKGDFRSWNSMIVHNVLRMRFIGSNGIRSRSLVEPITTIRIEYVNLSAKQTPEIEMLGRFPEKNHGTDRKSSSAESWSCPTRDACPTSLVESPLIRERKKPSDFSDPVLSESLIPIPSRLRLQTFLWPDQKLGRFSQITFRTCTNEMLLKIAISLCSNSSNW